MIKKGIMLGLLMIVTLIMVQAQNIDSDRMKRDLAVTENVLSTLLEESSDTKVLVGFRSRNVESEYIKDYGVIFTIGGGYGRGLALAPKAFTVKPNELRFAPNSSGEAVIINGYRSKDDKKGDQMPEPVDEAEEEKTMEEIQAEAKANFIKASKDFLADYAQLINQLKAEDRIMIRMTSGSSWGLSLGSNYAVNIVGDKFPEIYSQDETNEEVMVEATVKDIMAHQKGQISRDAFMQKIKVSEVERSFEKKADLEIVATMFHRLYQRDLSDTYYTLSNIRYSTVSGVGVVFKMRVYSSYESDRVFYIPSTGDKGLNLEERNEKIQELLPKFEKSFKENLVNYGRSVKSLEDNELLIFDVQLTQCKDCEDFPKGLKFSIKKSALDDFNNGKISESQAIGQVSVERVF